MLLIALIPQEHFSPVFFLVSRRISAPRKLDYNDKNWILIIKIRSHLRAKTCLGEKV